MPTVDDLTLLVTEASELDAVPAALRDWSAAGLIRPFASVVVERHPGAEPRARLVEDGELRELTLGDLLAQRSPKLVRILVLTSDRAGAATVGSAGRSAVSAVVGAGGRMTVTPAQVVVTRLGARSGGLVGVDGWHNLVLSPEDASDPSRPRKLHVGTAGPEDLARTVLPAIASLGALVVGVEESPLDGATVPPQGQFTVMRTFVRHLDGDDVRDALRAATLDLTDGYPLATEGTSSATYIENVAHASTTMARAVWQRHRSVLRSARQKPADQPVGGVGLWQAFRMLWSYLAAVVRNAPMTWVKAKITSGKVWAASTATLAIFGRDSAYAVVVGGVRGDRAVGLDDQLRALRELDSVLEHSADGHEVHASLAGLWRDVVNAGLTLLDGKDRGPGIDAVRIGDQNGVLRYGSQAAPSRAFASFPDLAGPLQAATGVATVAPYDHLAVLSLETQLGALAGDPLSGAAAGSALTALRDWWRRQQQTYTAQVATILGSEYTDRLAEIAHNAQVLRTAQAATGVPEDVRQAQSRLARRMLLVGVAFAILVVATLALFLTSVIGILALLVGVAVWLVGWLASSLVTFMKGQRLLFQLLHAREEAISRAAAAEYNLAAAIRDARRCGDAYQLLMLWSEALARFAADPLGTSHDVRTAGRGPGTDHPLCVQFGRATVDEIQVAWAAAALRRQVFPVGWLGAVWDHYLRDAATMLGPQGTALVDDPLRMYAQRAVQEDVLLPAWVAAVEEHGVGETAGVALWGRIVAALRGAASEQLDSLLETVSVETGGTETLGHFLVGLAAAGTSGGFPTELFADRAVTAGLDRVTVSWHRAASDGLGRTVVLCEMSEPMPAEDLQPAGGDHRSRREWPDLPDTTSMDSSALGPF